MNRSTMLPVVMVIAIAFIVLMTMFESRTNAPAVTGDKDYPHHICTTNRYCIGGECTETPRSFVVYLSHQNGAPRLELAGWSPEAAMTQTINGLEFQSTGGEINGTITIFNDRSLDITGSSVGDDGPLEHYASGSCSRLSDP